MDHDVSIAPPNAYSESWFDLFMAHQDHDHTLREVVFLKASLPQHEYPSVLDVCCGYGRHAIALAANSYRVLGIDRNANAVERARLMAASGNVDFRVHDMTRLGELPSGFDAVICMWQSYGYHDADTNRVILRNMRDRLRFGGRIVLDLYNRDFFLQRQGERITKVGTTTVLTRQQLVGDRLIVDLHYKDRDEFESFDWQVFDSQSIKALGEEVGLIHVRTSAQFDLFTHVTPEDPRMQVMFERRMS